MLQTVKIGKADTNGSFGLLEIVVPPGLGSPWHVHPEEDEWFYVLDGNLTFYVGDTRLDLTAGGFAFGPKGVPHTFIGAGPGPTRALVGFAPMQFEGFLREVGHPAPARVLPPPPAGPPPEIAKLAANRQALTGSSSSALRDRRPDDRAPFTCRSADLTVRTARRA